jgi:predicted MFS family arabinose efflux permease
MGGIVADLWSLRTAVWAAAGISVVSALIVAVRMYETHHRATDTETGIDTASEGADHG